MTFSANVLPLEAAYYTLTNATIVNKVMTIQAGGSASITIDKTILTAMTDHLKINLRPAVYTNSYDPETLIYLNVKTSTNSYNIAIAPVWDITGVLSAVFELEAGTYTNFTLTFTTTKTISFSVWEMCPEATADVDVTTIIDGVTQSLPKLLSDYNVTTLNITQEEDTVAIITCNLLANTDLQGHFLVDFELAEYSTVYVRFYDEDIEELFAPLQFTLNPGHNTITVPHAYLAKLAGIHSFIVTMQCTNGSITIYPRGMLFTVDGGYLAQRLIDIGIDMLDIAISQPNAADGPAEIYAIGIDGGSVLVRSRAYTVETASAEWTPKYAFGAAIDASIEFDGDWVRLSNAEKFTIQTYAIPYIFIVDDTGILTVRQGDGSATQLAVGVSQVSSIRGFKSTEYPDKDQGVIIAYIRAGKACYRQYAYYAATSSYIWYPEVTLVENDAKYIHTHRLNDYRVGFVVTTTTANTWYITDRTYVAQSVTPEIVTFDDVEGDYVAVAVYSDITRVFTGTIIDVETTEKQDTITVRFQYPPVLRASEDDLLSEMTYQVGSESFSFSHIRVSGNDLIFTLQEPIYGIVTVKSYYKIQLLTVGGYVLMTDVSWTWYLYSKITNNELEESNWSLTNNSLSVLMKPLVYMTAPNQYDEGIFGTIDLSASSILMKPIITLTHSQPYDEGDFGSVNLSSTTITVLLVGTSPI